MSDATSTSGKPGDILYLFLWAFLLCFCFLLCVCVPLVFLKNLIISCFDEMEGFKIFSLFLMLEAILLGSF